MMRLQSGQREPSYEASVRRMLAGGLGGDTEGDDVSVSVYSGMSRKVRKESKVGREEGKRPSMITLETIVDCETDCDAVPAPETELQVPAAAPVAAAVPVRAAAATSSEEADGPTEVEDLDASSDDSDISDSESDSDDDSEEGEGEDWVDRKGDGKYRKQLPARDDPTARSAEKDSRKEARKLAKEQAAKKRTEKVPKHVKKRAIKAGKKK
jgi:hypothetical protein